MTMVRRRLGSVGAFLGLLPYLGFALFPFYWMLLTSLRRNAEIYDVTNLSFLVQKGATLQHYVFLLTGTQFPAWFWNSLLVSVVATAISVVISTAAAYGLVRLPFRGSSFFSIGIFVTYLVPPTLLFIPLFRVVTALGLSDSRLSLIVTYPTFVVPFCTWLLMSYFATIPKELEECAIVDGATRAQVLLKIVLPVALPGVVTATLFSFTLAWGEFIYALTFIASGTHKTLTAGTVAELIRGDVFHWGPLMAGALLASVPVVIAYGFLMDYYVSGLVAGATKY
ncbi:MAG: carbohydrate ABC transporter permease [candidate division NC10 bacterium]|nr:carbohydrate ABC transporter permease [candidate division NC10 bacterium]